MSTVSPERIVVPRYCHQCGGQLIERLIRSERPTRLTCESCGFIHYMDARVVCAIIVERSGNVLLQQRAMGPRSGYWTFPGGFLEVGESTAEGALRETKEEVGLDVTLGPLHGVYTRPHVGIVMVVYRGTSTEGEATVADDESSAVRWFAPDEIPWDDLAFDTTISALRDWVAGG
jgi:ADP-ribose pyrophosphatase YjhB (NUDIX family)/predicted RNA-binding Zn-ribbon protein involved in translation (DUF1610 family)